AAPANARYAVNGPENVGTGSAGGIPRATAPSCQRPAMLNPLPFDELTVAFARIKGLLLTEEKVDRAVRGLVEAAKDAIPGTVGAGISLRERQHGAPGGCYTDEVLKQEDGAQLEAGQGPCITAWTSGQASSSTTPQQTRDGRAGARLWFLCPYARSPARPSPRETVSSER
ncbi:hypothetical protein AHiyo6_29000, partial [Arthrobacter sp. Hiyo6]